MSNPQPEPPPPVPQPAKEPARTRRPKKAKLRPWQRTSHFEVANLIMKPHIYAILLEGVTSKKALMEALCARVGTFSKESLRVWLKDLGMDTIFNEPRLYKLPSHSVLAGILTTTPPDPDKLADLNEDLEDLKTFDMSADRLMPKDPLPPAPSFPHHADGAGHPTVIPTF